MKTTSLPEGYIVPVIRFLLSLHQYWGIANSWIPAGKVPVDIYLSICWAVEGVSLLLCSRAGWFGWLAWVFVIGLLYRLADLFHVLLKRLIFGGYERGGHKRASRERALILALFNMAEVVAIYA